MKRVFLVIILLLTITDIVFAETAPESIVASFGREMSLWCETGDISHRKNVEALCDGLKKCRVEDIIHADYQVKQGLTDYSTFVLDSYLNMFASLMHDGLKFNLSNVKLESQDFMPDGQTLSFVTVDIEVCGQLNHKVRDLILVRDDKISGVYSYNSKLGFSHLNGSLIDALTIGRYTWATNFHNGFAQVANEAGHVGLIDLKGNIIIPCMWDAMDYTGGKFARGFNYRDNKASAMYDLRYGGKRVPLEWVQDYIIGRDKRVETFSDGFAVVKNSEGKYGFLAENDSTYNVKYLFDDVSNFQDGYASVTFGGNSFLINKDFTIHRTLDINKYDVTDHYYEGLAAVKDKNTGKWGFMDIKGKIVIPCQFDNVGYFSEGICYVKKDDNPSRSPYYQSWKTAIINKKGELITDYIFEQPLGDFEDGYIEMLMEIDGNLKGSLIDSNGKPLPGFNWKYDNIRYFREGLARFTYNEKMGFLDKEGNIAVPPIYDLAWYFYEGYACVGKKVDGETKYGCINKDGIVVIPFIYDDKFFFSNGVALVEKDNRIGLIDTFGNSTFFKEKGN